jgi:serine/threonine-protein kinase
VWALGVILYEILTGRAPFTGNSVTDLAIRIATEAPPAPRSLRPELPEELAAIILRCLEKHAESRFATVEALAAALESFAGTSRAATLRTVSQTDRAAGAATPEALARTQVATPSPTEAVTSTQANWGSTSRNRKRAGQRPAVIAIAIVGFGVVATAGYFALRPSSPGVAIRPGPDMTAASAPSVSVVSSEVAPSVAASPQAQASAASSAAAAPTASAPSPVRPVQRGSTPARPAPARPAATPTATVDPGSVR